MMNLQELQTILTNKLPIKIFLINNNGYHSIRLTQNNLFKDHCKIGIGPESGDLSFPEFRKIAEAFGYPYSCAHSNAEMKQVVDAALAAEGPTFCEIFTDTQQVWEQKPPSACRTAHWSARRLRIWHRSCRGKSWNSRCLSPWCRKGKKIKNEKSAEWQY